ncbi:transmembrane protein 53-like [Harmonia axyridis]|uniref:transmembrane protein 53-like n=1 Tax=Harmonia axyridis TaxID=115357 RepID=UPI001E2778D1|nr:transmembrane protein 53-like [Harmonia axyridis]
MSFFMEPGFDYTITIPDPNGDYSKNKEDCDFKFPFDEKKKPVIILFGWAGCIDKHLQIYSQIYEAKGFMTIRFIVSTKSMFLSKQDIIPISEKMVRVIEDLNIVNQPIFIHCCSNGGSYIYQHFAEAMKSSKKQFRIRGMIFDSAPSRTSTTSLAAIRRMVNQSKYFNLVVALFFQALCFILWFSELIGNVIFRRNIIQFEPMKYLLEEENKFPQHFIYSKNDKVIPYQDVEFFINKRKSIGVEVSIKCYTDTEHVRHYPMKKYTYTQSIFNFISHCLDLESSMV